MKKNSGKERYCNHLKAETSPYLKMHVHNPVDWYPWGAKALRKADRENKLMVISIGYSACHWCHVMEKESFRDVEVARIMNQHFISLKIDREERPDIDQIYMSAAQIITGRGGWPLNVITLPDGRPVYAGTYFPKKLWISLLRQINEIFKKNPEKLFQQAEAITNGIRTSEVIHFKRENLDFSRKDLDTIFKNLEKQIDFENGGFQGEPKFPLPIIHDFLLMYFHISGNKKALQAAEKTLDAMALGGIYDQIGGGFSRYSTDKFWKVPHFEKMLYDNAQLVSLYSNAYQLTRKPLYKKVIHQTLDFIQREMTTPEFPGNVTGTYSALDADSDGEEGRFYTWTASEINNILGNDAKLISEYYNILPAGNWEREENILYRNMSDAADAKENNFEPDKMQKTITRSKLKLLEVRSKRTRLKLDDKIITAWNALMINGYLDAYRLFNEDKYLKSALKHAFFITTYIMEKKGRLKRIYKESTSEIDAFLDDYAFTIKAFISLYQATFDENWLWKADLLLTYAKKYFYDGQSGMFYYTSGQDPQLISRKMEITDHVIPASNSTMALNLFHLGIYFKNDEYIEKSRQMLNNVKTNLLGGGIYYANWAILMSYFIEKPIEIAIVGENWLSQRKKLDRYYLPQAIFMGGVEEGKLPFMQNKLKSGKTLIYICRDNTCLSPVSDIDTAMIHIRGNNLKILQP